MNKIIEPEDLLPPLRDLTGKSITIEQICYPVGPGWHPLIEQLIKDLINLGWDGVLDPVKEKFGGLRCMIFGTTKAMDDLIEAAESRSLRICEECGAKGRTAAWDGYWLKTLCSKHGVVWKGKK